jgi:hypothetical protein
MAYLIYHVPGNRVTFPQYFKHIGQSGPFGAATADFVFEDLLAACLFQGFHLKATSRQGKGVKGVLFFLDNGQTYQGAMERKTRLGPTVLDVGLELTLA